MKILITGGTGFVGKALVERIVRDGVHESVSSLRKSGAVVPGKSVVVGDLTPDTDWTNALKGIDTVIHCAARVHVMEDRASDPLAEYRRVNCDGTLNLAKQAQKSGVTRFVFLSTIKVNGEGTKEKPFTADDQPDPTDPYAISKYEAEQKLLELADEAVMTVTIIRPPLVYGPYVKANFLSMMKWLQKGIPLPLGAISNKRSMVGLDNLVDLIITSLNHPKAVNQVFLAGDDRSLSLTELLVYLGNYLKRPALLIPVPVVFLRVIFWMIGKKSVIERLAGSLEVDISKTKSLLDWKPILSVEDGLRKTAETYLKSNERK